MSKPFLGRQKYPHTNKITELKFTIYDIKSKINGGKKTEKKWARSIETDPKLIELFELDKNI